MRFLRRLWALVRRGRFHADLEEELRFHLERTAEEVGSIHEARRKFGNVGIIREQTLDAVTFQTLEGVWRDVHRAVRSLRRTPALLSVAALSLGLGIATTSTLYSLVDALLFHDVTARAPEQLVSFARVSYLDYKDIRASGVFEDLAAGSQCFPALRWRVGEATKQVIADCLSANFFEVVGGAAAIGRVFTSEEAAPEKNPRIVVVSYRFWQRELSADSNVIGRSLTLNNTAFIVIGVLPADYRAIQGFGISPDIFVPYNTIFQPKLFERRPPVLDTIAPIGRLVPGRTRNQTSQALLGAFRALAERFPREPGNVPTVPQLTPVAGLAKYGQSQFDQSVVRFSVVLGAVTLLVLLIGCANVSGLLLARGVARRREIALRLSIGASRRQLVRQFFLEAAVVALAGTIAGAALTFASGRLLGRIDVPVQDVTVRFNFSPDWRFAAMLAGLGIIATFASGLVPAFSLSRSDLAHLLTASRGTTAPRLRIRAFLVSGQIAISVVLLTGGFLFGRNLLLVLGHNPGFDTRHTVWLDFAVDRRQPQAAQIAGRDRLYHALESYPGVQNVSWAWYLPFQLVYSEPKIHRDGAPDSQGISVIEQGIGPDYLKTMGIPIVAGREFEWRDLTHSSPGLPPPVIVNEALASTFFKGGNPVGARLMRLGPNGPRSMVIIGVSANTAFRNPADESTPLLQSLNPISPSFVIHSSNAERMAPELSRVIERNAPGAGAGYFTMAERYARATWPARAAAVLLGVLATTGLILAMIGLSGITIYNVARRTPEIGIRMALGGSRGQVLRLMLVDGLKLVSAGALSGIAGALALTRFVASFLTADLNPADPSVFTWIIATLAATTFISIWLPCQRAARVDPSTSLRAE